MNTIDNNNPIILKITKEYIGKFYKLKTQNNKNFIYILKFKNIYVEKIKKIHFELYKKLFDKKIKKEKIYSIIIIINRRINFYHFKLKNVINDKNKYISIFLKISENQFQKSLKLMK